MDWVTVVLMHAKWIIPTEQHQYMDRKHSVCTGRPQQNCEKKVLKEGLEPSAFALGGRRAIHCAT